MPKYKRGTIKNFICRNRAAIQVLEKDYRNKTDIEIYPYARNVPFDQIAETVMPDRVAPWNSPVHMVITKHMTTIGAETLAKQGQSFLEGKKWQYDFDILSVAAGIEEGKLRLLFLIREYEPIPSSVFTDELFAYIAGPENEPEGPPEQEVKAPEVREYSSREVAEHRYLVQKQHEAYLQSDDETPFLNMIDSYVPQKLYTVSPLYEGVYDLVTKDMQISTISTYQKFNAVFRRCMQYVTSVEKDLYYNVIRGQTAKKDFDVVLRTYINTNYIERKLLPAEDLHALLDKLDRSLFQMYIIQDLIDDPGITDIKVTTPYSIRVRHNGKALSSNITFIDDEDYARFITSLAFKNNISLKVPTQTFTDESDRNYILRFSITAPYVTSTGYPIIHVRKVPRKKLMADDLIAAGMFDEKIRDYLLDCGKFSKGVVFAGPPGSGKTTALNWFLEEAYESSAEILVIQENDELFSNRNGVMFEHVVNNPQNGERRCTLEDLGQMALVAGANVFVIGEAKGAEICSAITLSNSGCRTAITIHSQSATDTIDKMADLAMRGYANSYEQAKRMMKSFQTIVYMEDFKIMEISEITGYDEHIKDMRYKSIYKRNIRPDSAAD